MSPEFAVHLVRDALMMMFWLAAPLLLVGFVIGVLVSLVQIITSIQDSAFSTIPRLVAFLAALLLFMPWMLERIKSYTITLFSDFGRYAQ